jgi:NADPH:quinone reductase-like Zn-dependent oxidoreductase
MDLSGVVRAVSAGVTRVRVGDEVFASPNHHRMGSYAELAVVDERELAPKPQSLSHEQAASLPLVALTAWDALVTRGKIAAGSRVLIQAGAGGVGTVAIQIAKHFGAEVLTTCSADNAALVRELGADVVIDYHSSSYQDAAQGCDVIVDSLGPAHWRQELATVRRGGRIIGLTTGLPAATARFGPILGAAVALTQLAGFALRARLAKNVRFIPMSRAPSGDNLARIAELVDRGALRPVIDSVFSLDRAGDAHRRVEAGHCHGKVVLAIAG